jgi:hypothetical protein
MLTGYQASLRHRPYNFIQASRYLYHGDAIYAFAVFAAVSRAASASGTALASLGRVECIPVHCPAVLTVRMLLHRLTTL